MAEILEACMVISFGVSWPASIVKSYKAKTAKGKSLLFLICILFGYLCGIVSKFWGGKVNYVLFFYILNAFMVSVDLLLYFRNKKLDRENSSAKAS